MKSRTLIALLVLLFSSGLNTAVSQWYQIPGLESMPITCILTTGDSTIFVGGHWKTLLRSTDNGMSWTNVRGTTIIGDTVLSLHAAGGYIFVGIDGYYSVYRSSDNGDSWSLANNGLPAYRVFGFAAVDTILYAATMNGVYSSSNNGEMWKTDTAGLGYNRSIPGGTSNSTVAITRTATKLFVMKDFARGVYASRTDTIRWFPIGLKNKWGYTIAAIDTNVFATTITGVYLYSGSDTTWFEWNTGLPSSVSSGLFTAVDSFLFVHAGGVNGIYASGDRGLHWELLRDSFLDNKQVNGMVGTKTHLIAETDGVGAWSLPVADIVLSAGSEDPPSPSSFRLSQNFPNPFNPETAISYKLSAVSSVRLSVFDVLGREIAVLVNERQRAGDHTVKWNAENRTSGVYLVRLQTGTFLQTRKMVLVR